MEEVIHVFDWFQLASNKEKRMVQLRRYLHQYPELSFEENVRMIYCKSIEPISMHHRNTSWT